MYGNEIQKAIKIVTLPINVKFRCTVEPPNKGHFGIGAFVLYSEAVLW